MKLSFPEIKELIELFLKVETKDQEIIPFYLNKMQVKLFEILEKARLINKRDEKPLRIIILKGRQFGISTVMLALLFIKCLIVPNTRAVVISHTDDATRKLFRRVKFFANMMELKPHLDKESEKEFSFPKTNSYFYIGTAGSKAFGRGDNLTDVHCSEVAFWDNAAVLMNGLINAVGKTGTITIETTANGIGNYLHKIWKKSYGAKNPAWTAIFLKWTQFEEYEMKPEPNFRLTEHEKLLKQKYPELTDRKLQWRRFKIAETEGENGFTPEQMFEQEYPLSEREAFISSGNMAFSADALERQIPINPIDVENGFKIWKKPSGYSVMGIDTAEGLENHDRSVIDVYDENMEQVVHWAGWCDPDELAALAVIIGIRYNSYIVCESNSIGLATQHYLRRKYPIGKQYHREVLDKVSKQKVEKLGFKTSPNTTKPKMISDLVLYIREGLIKFNNLDTIDECLTYIKTGNGKYEAQQGCNDDRVMAPALALQGYLDRPPRTALRSPEGVEKEQIKKLNAQWRKKKAKELKKKHKL